MNDIMAGGVYEFTAREELKVGTDLDLIGFDNREVAQAYNPTLTTIKLPLNRIGRKAAEIMINILENGRESIQKNLYKINCELIIRDSLRK